MNGFGNAMALVLSLLMLAPGVSTVAATEQQSLVSRQEIDDAIRQSSRNEERAREGIRDLLSREDVRELARDSGLGLEMLDRAKAAAGALEGAELEQAAAYAAELSDRLAGGETISISISLVALLVIVILILILSQ